MPLEIVFWRHYFSAAAMEDTPGHAIAEGKSHPRTVFFPLSTFTEHGGQR
jgi:hypothetical protein